MSDWKVVAAILAFVGWMATDARVNRKRLRLAGLLALALVGYKTVPVVVASLQANTNPMMVRDSLHLQLGPGVGGLGTIFGTRTGGGADGGFVYGAPNTPTVDAAVLTGDTIAIITGSAFVGSGDAAHDSSQFTVVLNSGDFGSPLWSSSTGAQTSDTTTTNLTPDSVYKARVRYKADPNKGGWSAWSDSVQFTATSLPTPVFASSFGSGTGKSIAVLLDSSSAYGAWTGSNDLSSEPLEVVTVSSLGLTSPGFANCLKVTPTPPSGTGRVIHDGLSDLAVGDSRNYRIYFARLGPLAGEPLTGSWHPADLQPTGGSGRWMELFPVDYNSDGTWEAPIVEYDAGTSGPDPNLNGLALLETPPNPPTDGDGVLAQLSIDTFYGREVRFERIATDSVHITDAWVYNAAGTTIYGPEDHAPYISSGAGGGPGHSGPSLADSVMWAVRSDLDFDNWRLGSNGFPLNEGPYDGIDPWGCYGGVAIVDNVAQIGPWNGSY